MFDDWVYINITSGEPLSSALLEWTNSSGPANYSMTNSSMSAWSVNVTGLADGTYNYAIWAQQLAGGEWSMGETRHVLVDTMQPYSIAACQDLTVENGSYVLTQDVSSDGTCFTVKANNITLDGGGTTLAYAQISTGYAVDGEFGYDYATIRNLRIVQDNTETGYNPAIYLSGVDNGTITNNTIATLAEGVTGIYLYSSNSNTISNNTITTSGGQSFGIDVYSSGSNVISNNGINMSGSDSHGIEIEFYSNLNVVSNNSVAVLGDSGFGIRIILADSNAASYNKITASGYDVRAIYLEESDANIISGNRIVSSSDDGHGIDLRSSDANALLNNTITILGTPGYGVDLEVSDGNTISGTTLEGYGDENHGINLEASNFNTLFNNTITESGTISHGVWLIESSNWNVVLNNTITTYGPDDWSIRVMSSDSNNVTGSSIASRLSYDYYLEDIGTTNNFTNTDFTKQRRIWLGDGSSWFNYYVDGNRSIKTRLSEEATGEIKRNIGEWTGHMTEWSDAPGADGTMTVSYDLTGLSANTQYHVFNISMEDLTHPYELMTDLDGNLPPFSIGLNGNTTIIVHNIHGGVWNLTAQDRYGCVMENVTVIVRDGTGTVVAYFELNASVPSQELIIGNLESEYDIAYLAQSGNTLELENVTTLDNATINPQFVYSYSGPLPVNTSARSSMIALNHSQLMVGRAEVALPLSGEANRILHCHFPSWDFASAECISWDSKPMSYYNAVVNSTHLRFNVTEFDAYMAAYYDAPPVQQQQQDQPTGGGGGSGGGGGLAGGPAPAKSISVTLDWGLTFMVNLRAGLLGPSINAAWTHSVPVPSLPPAGRVYLYLNITETGFNNSDIESATIDFRVNTSWLNSKNITRVYLARYERGWKKLRTDLVSSTGQYNEYRAYADAFSYFAVIGEKASASLAAVSTAGPVIENGTGRPGLEPLQQQRQRKERENPTPQEDPSGRTVFGSVWFGIAIPVVLASTLMVVVLLLSFAANRNNKRIIHEKNKPAPLRTHSGKGGIICE